MLIVLRVGLRPSVLDEAKSLSRDPASAHADRGIYTARECQRGSLVEYGMHNVATRGLGRTTDATPPVPSHASRPPRSAKTIGRHLDCPATQTQKMTTTQGPADGLPGIGDRPHPVRRGARDAFSSAAEGRPRPSSHRECRSARDPLSSLSCSGRPQPQQQAEGRSHGVAVLHDLLRFARIRTQDRVDELGEKLQQHIVRSTSQLEPRVGEDPQSSSQS